MFSKNIQDQRSFLVFFTFLTLEGPASCQFLLGCMPAFFEPAIVLVFFQFPLDFTETFE